jgi:hypothetical protein
MKLIKRIGVKKYILFTLYTVEKPSANAGPEHVGDGKFRQPRRLSGPIIPILLCG